MEVTKKVRDTVVGSVAKGSKPLALCIEVSLSTVQKPLQSRLQVCSVLKENNGF